jgi:hypothetical protein
VAIGQAVVHPLDRPGANVMPRSAWAGPIAIRAGLPTRLPPAK